MIQAASRITQSQKLISQENQQQKKLKRLFYVKSKHTRKNFKNHPYFRTATQINPGKEKLSQSVQNNHNPTHRSLINQKRLKTQSHHELKNTQRFNKQFVNYPTQFGLQNTYNYLREKSFIAKFESESSLNSNRKLGRKSPSSQRKINTQGNEESFQGGGKNYMKITASYQSKFYNTVKTEQQEKETSLSGYEKHFRAGLESKFRKKPLAIFRVMEKRESISINNQPQLSQSKLNDNIANVKRNIIYNAPILKNSSIKTSTYQVSSPTGHKIQFIYAKRLSSIAQIPYRTITFDIFPAIITTFLKCKIHYSQMTQAEYDFINQAMIKVLESKKKSQKYDIKDIINIGSIREVIKFLQQFKGEQKGFQWLETIRYFFLMKDEKVLDYYMNKIKQEVAQLIAIKFDVEFGQKELFVYDLEKRTQVFSIYDLIKGQRFLISDNDKVLVDYLALQNEQFEKQTLQAKIMKWKSIADYSAVRSENSDLQASKISRLQQSKSVRSPATPALCPAKKLSEEKFKNIFEQFKIRQKKRLSKKSYACGSNSVNHSVQTSFLEKSKLRKQQDFFQ